MMTNQGDFPKFCGSHKFRDVISTARGAGSVRVLQCNDCIAIKVVQAWLKRPEEFVTKKAGGNPQALYWEVETIVLPQERFLR